MQGVVGVKGESGSFVRKLVKAFFPQKLSSETITQSVSVYNFRLLWQQEGTKSYLLGFKCFCAFRNENSYPTLFAYKPKTLRRYPNKLKCLNRKAMIHY